MYGFVLQDWTTVEVDYTLPNIVQAERDWVSFRAFQDIVFWLEVRAINLGGGTAVNMFFDTSPTKDESLFTAMYANGDTLTVGAPIIRPILMSASPAVVPLARWVRWRLTGSGDQGSNYGATFRILCSANAVGVLGR